MTVKCPCLLNAVTPICRADTQAMRIPPVEHLSRLCLSERYRGCDVYRRFLGALAAEPKHWRSRGSTFGEAPGEAGD